MAWEKMTSLFTVLVLMMLLPVSRIMMLTVFSFRKRVFTNVKVNILNILYIRFKKYNINAQWGGYLETINKNIPIEGQASMGMFHYK